MKRLIVVLAVALCAAGQAQAHVQRGQGSYRHRLEVRMAHDRGVIRAVDRQAVRSGSWLLIEERLWLTRQWHVRDLAKAGRALRLLTRPAHYYGWLCIHSREGSWTANTGNGFYGGLQMTYGWMGIVRDAHMLSPLQQMQAAELGYQRSGYSHAWLAGQWPNTYPPCARYF